MRCSTTPAVIVALVAGTAAAQTPPGNFDDFFQVGSVAAFILGSPVDSDLVEWDISPIGSSTRLDVIDRSADSNAFQTFIPGRIAPNVDAGNADGTSSNIEVNLFAGSIGSGFQLYPGATLNVLGGTLEGNFEALDAEEVNIRGGVVAPNMTLEDTPLDISGGTIQLGAVNMTGGQLTVTGGTINGSIIYSSGLFGLNALVNGGRVTNQLNFFGPGNATVGGNADIEVIFTRDAVDLFVVNNAVVRLLSPGEDTFTFIRDNAAISDVSLSSPGTFANLTMQGGAVDRMQMGNNARLTFTGGSIDDLDLGSSGSQTSADLIATVDGGTVTNAADVITGELRFLSGSIGSPSLVRGNGLFTMSGGSLGDQFTVSDDGVFVVSGGDVGAGPRASPGGTVRILGRDFRINGVEIAGLTPTADNVITTRGGTLTCTLDDGSPLTWNLAPVLTSIPDGFFDPAATLVLVPPSPADINFDRRVDAGDLQRAVIDVSAFRGSADFDGNGSLNAFDVIEFTRIFRDATAP